MRYKDFVQICCSVTFLISAHSQIRSYSKSRQIQMNHGGDYPESFDEVQDLLRRRTPAVFGHIMCGYVNLYADINFSLPISPSPLL